MATLNIMGKLPSKLFNKEVDFEEDTVKLMLLTSSANPNIDTHIYIDDISEWESSGIGYTAGGNTLTGKSISYDSNSNTTTFEADDIVWNNITANFRYGALYSEESGVILGYMDFGEDFNINDSAFSFSFNNNDFFYLKSYFMNHLSTWETSNTSTGSSNSNQIKLPTESDGNYDCTVYWGDGTSDVITSWNDSALTHTYAIAGTYQINIEGTFEGVRFNNTGDRLKLLSIDEAGENFSIGNNNSYFYGCDNLIGINGLDTSNITDISSIFRNCSNFNQQISSFNTLNVINMNYMFQGCNKFNQSLDLFDTSNLISMFGMFWGCDKFNQTVNHFNVSNVNTMSYAFFGCKDFNQPVSNWNTSNVVNMHSLFRSSGFNQSVDNFNTLKVIDMQSMFRDSAFNQSVSNFNTQNVVNMSNMFNGCTNFNQSVSNFNFESVTNITNMFTNATSWSTSNYNSFLITAASQDVNVGLTFACSSHYTLGGDAETAKNYLISTKGWSITDLGGI